MLSSTRKRRVMLNPSNMRPQQIAYPMAAVTVEELEVFYGYGYAYACSADHEAAVLTAPWADEDVVH